VIELLAAGLLSHPFEIRTGWAWPDRISIKVPLHFSVVEDATQSSILPLFGLPAIKPAATVTRQIRRRGDHGISGKAIAQGAEAMSASSPASMPREIRS
jgi:hypothetical protein